MDCATNKRSSKISTRLLVPLFVIFIIGQCKAQHINRCTSKETCRKCIEADPRCAWCSQVNYTDMDVPRCDFLENLDGNCDDLVNAENFMNITKNRPLSDKKIGDEKDEAIQIKPQEIEIKLRPNTPETFSMDFSQAKDYPIDLYLLMDLSHSMADDKATLAQLGNKLAEEMGSITADFRLGFGSFVDKVAAPYVAVHPTMLRHPCDGCASPYGFRNQMPLSSQTEIFARKVYDAEVSGNLDSPEGTLDAIMQAIVCQNAIGWRPKSRKLLVVCTDNDYHYAGDGKLAGITEPNDCKCHLDTNGYYWKSTKQDYPSISQLKRKIKENNVNLIFAVTSDQVDHYKNLTNALGSGSTTGKLEKDSSNVVQLVRQQYEAISSFIEMMTDTAQKSGNIEVSYSSSCLDGEMKKRNVCKGLKVLNTVTFEVAVKFSFCPTNRDDWNQTIQIYPVGLNEYLTVHLEMMCECDCEKPEREEPDSPKCNFGNGTYECGVCNCYAGKYGKQCECDGGESESSPGDSKCYLGNDEYVCSNRGRCRCGKCYCYERENKDEMYSGTHCECSNFGCEQVDQRICNGRGRCDCGICKCFSGWSGSDCSCMESNLHCIDDRNGKECGEKGKCVCGECECEDTYYGKYCDDCPSCAGKCDEYSECVECFLYSREKKLNAEECVTCQYMSLEIVDKVEVNETEKEKSCSHKDVNDCNILFKYRMGENNRPIIYLQTEKECPLPPNVLAIVSGTTGSIVVAGLLLLLIWKLVTTIHDRRELAKFERERANAQWNAGENPIYVQAVSTFQNPAYRGSQRSASTRNNR